MSTDIPKTMSHKTAPKRFSGRSNKTYIFFPAAVGGGSYQMAFYRVNVPPPASFIGQRVWHRFSRVDFGFFIGERSLSRSCEECWETGKEDRRSTIPPRPRKTNSAIRIRAGEIWIVRFKGHKMTRRWWPL